MKKAICFLLMGMLMGMTVARADIIYVSGDVWGTWSADTVVVTAEVRVPPGETLIIVPGVEVFFEQHYKFVVDQGATLSAIGTQDDSIRFDEGWQWTDLGWHGIRFLSASSDSRLEYCHLKNGYAWGSVDDANGGAIYCYNSSPTVQNCLIDSCSATEYGGAIYCDSLSDATISGNNVNANSAGDYGGGIYCYSSSPTISGNNIDGNFATYGGGIYCSESSPTISSNFLSGNTAYSVGGGIYCEYSCFTISDNTLSGNLASDDGGGIFCNGSNPTINGNTLSGNLASDDGGGIYCNISNPAINSNTLSGNSASGGGGGIYCFTSNPTIYDNTLSGNSANYDGGGGIFCSDSSPTISGNTLSGNSANNYGYGGGIYLTGSTLDTFELNEITQNTASGYGGGIYAESSSLTSNKNTIAENTAAQGGGINSISSSSVLINCILWGNAPEQIYLESGSSLQATYSDIQGGWSGMGNINADPLFWYPALHDYYLQEGSPCIDTGDPGSNHNDPDGSRADMGCHPYDSTHTGVELPSDNKIPNSFSMRGCYPNPFNPTTVIGFDLPVAGYVKLEVFDVAGRLVGAQRAAPLPLVNGWRQAGHHEVTFDGSGLASGVYIYRLEAGDYAAMGKMVLLK